MAWVSQHLQTQNRPQPAQRAEDFSGDFKIDFKPYIISGQVSSNANSVNFGTVSPGDYAYQKLKRDEFYYKKWMHRMMDSETGAI